MVQPRYADQKWNYFINFSFSRKKKKNNTRRDTRRRTTLQYYYVQEYDIIIVYTNKFSLSIYIIILLYVWTRRVQYVHDRRRLRLTYLPKQTTLDPKINRDNNDEIFRPLTQTHNTNTNARRLQREH